MAAAASVGDLPGIAGSSNAAAYLTASKPHQLALFTNLTNVEVNRIDAIYMTRAQRERHVGESTANYPRLSRTTLGSALAKDARIMHPLPRVDEIDYDVERVIKAVTARHGRGKPLHLGHRDSCAQRGADALPFHRTMLAQPDDPLTAGFEFSQRAARPPVAGSGPMNMRRRGGAPFPLRQVDSYSICFVAIATAAL